METPNEDNNHRDAPNESEHDRMADADEEEKLKRLMERAIARFSPERDVQVIPSQEETITEKMKDVKLEEIIACNNCSQVCKDPLQCPECHTCTYCKEECRLEHWNKIHHRKCECIKISGPGKNKYKVVPSPGNSFGKICVATEDLPQNFFIKSELPLAAVIFYTKEQLDTLSPEAIHALFGDKDRIGTIFFPNDSADVIPFDNIADPILRPISQLTSLLAKKHSYIGKANYFHTTLCGSESEVEAVKSIHSWLADPSVSDKQVSSIFGSMIINATQCVPLLTPAQISFGFFPAASMFNHSCNPNADVKFTAGKIHIYSNRPIKAGEEITIDYLGGKACISGRSERQKMLQKFNNFECRCPKCRESLDFVPSSLTLEAYQDSLTDLARKIMKEMRENYEKKNYLKVAKIVQRLWDSDREALLRIPYTLINIVYTASISVIMTTEDLYTNTFTTLCEMIDYCIFLMHQDAINTLIDGEKRSVGSIIDLLSAAIIVIMFKRILSTISQKTEEEALEYVANYFSNPQILEMAKIQARPHLERLYSKPLKMNILLPDNALNRFVKYLPIIISYLVK